MVNGRAHISDSLEDNNDYLNIKYNNPYQYFLKIYYMHTTFSEVNHLNLIKTNVHINTPIL